MHADKIYGMLRDSRRGFFTHMLGAAWTSAARASALAQRAVALPKLFDLHKAAEGVYLAQARPQTLVNSNAVIFERSRDLLILDAHSKPSAAAALVRQIRAEITQKPVRYVVASHFHWDHTHGLPAYKGSDFVSSYVTRKMMDSETLPRLKAQMETIGGQAAGYRERARGAKSAEERADLELMAREAEDYLKEMRGFRPELPSITLERDLILHDGGGDLHISFRGRAHTAGDVVVFSPSKKVIASGDVLHASTPFIGDGYPRDWPRTLHQFAEFRFEIICGGHGALQRDRGILFRMANYLEEISKACAEWKRKGRSLAELQSSLTPEKLISFRDGGYGETVGRTILAYRRMPRPLPTAEQVLAEALRVNLEHVWNGLDRI